MKRFGNHNRIDTMEELRNYIFEKSMPIPQCGCWIWMQNISTAGYGEIPLASFEAKYGRRVNRLSYIAFKGEISDGLFVCHSCDIKSCVNPDHLWLGTNADNQNDLGAKNISWWQKATHCQNGHPITADSFYLVQRRGKKMKRCRQCEADAKIRRPKRIRSKSK